MEQKIMDCLNNTIKCRLLLEIYSAGQATAKQLSEIYSDIPQATLYRYLKRMTDDGILKIAGENQVRGTIEKTYAVAIDFGDGVKEMLDDNAGDAYMQLFMNYVLGFIRKFQDYCKKPDINIVEDMSGFSLVPIYASDEELKSAFTEYAKIFQTLHVNKPAPGRKPRTIGMIVSPPENYSE